MDMNMYCYMFAGRKYNKEGILSPWWNNASIDRFNGRTECMVDQYKRYTVNGENVRLV